MAGRGGGQGGGGPERGPGWRWKPGRVLRVWQGGEEIQPEMCREGLGANRALLISLGKAEGSADWTEPGGAETGRDGVGSGGGSGPLL